MLAIVTFITIKPSKIDVLANMVLFSRFHGENDMPYQKSIDLLTGDYTRALSVAERFNINSGARPYRRAVESPGRRVEQPLDAVELERADAPGVIQADEVLLVDAFGWA